MRLCPFLLVIAQLLAVNPRYVFERSNQVQYGNSFGCNHVQEEQSSATEVAVSWKRRALLVVEFCCFFRSKMTLLNCWDFRYLCRVWRGIWD